MIWVLDLLFEMINCQARTLRDWSKSKKLMRSIGVASNQYFDVRIPYQKKHSPRHSARSMSRTELSEQRLIRKENSIKLNSPSMKTNSSKDHQSKKPANKIRIGTEKIKESVKFSQFLEQKSKNRKKSCEQLPQFNSRQTCRTSTNRTRNTEISPIKEPVYLEYFPAAPNPPVQQPRPKPTETNSSPFAKNLITAKSLGLHQRPIPQNAPEAPIQISLIKRMTIQQLEKLEQDLANYNPSLSSLILNGRQQLRVSNYSLQQDIQQNNKDNVLYSKKSRDESTNHPESNGQDEFVMDIPQMEVLKMKGNQIRFTDKRPDSIYTKANLLSRLRTTSHTVHEKIQLHCQTIRLFSEMLELKESPVQGYTMSERMRFLLASKYLLELQRIEATIKGYTNCFTLKDIAVNSQQLRIFVNSWNGKQFQHTLFLDSREASIKRRKYFGNQQIGQKELLQNFSNSLFMQQLRTQYGSTLQTAKFFSLQVYEKIGWIMFAAFLSEELRNPQSRCFTDSALTHKQDEFVHRNNELFQSITY